MLFPEPTLSLTLPSLHDATVLECRIYHPPSLVPSVTLNPSWHRHSAIFAHPYGSLGGSYDDHIVMTATAVLIRQGYLVTTFNFRGAGKSHGRTSWSGKPEISDYMSVIGFVVHYIHYLDPFHERYEPTNLASREATFTKEEQPVLILGGYSYGSLITMQLPPLFVIMQKFLCPEVDSVAAEIVTKARHLAMNQTSILSSLFDNRLSFNMTRSPRRSLGMRVGGNESSHRHSQEARRSLSLDAEEKIRKGLAEVKTRLGHKRHSKSSLAGSATIEKKSDMDVAQPTSGKEKQQQQDATNLDYITNLAYPRAAYLLVSPLQGTISHLAAISFNPTGILGRYSSQRHANNATEAKLWLQDTIAIFGDNDVFVSVGKLRSWRDRMTSMNNSKFEGHEISGAGHFWNEEGTLETLASLMRDFSRKLLRNNPV